ncbi:hypothetical protein BDZ89DRAFT_1027753 [Hymenopellis radicata]|nr:hypothetical protein BDZ89DRAFT_1027753 [Hymenopellis radicata]
MSWASIDLHSHRTQLVATAITVSVATGTVLSAYDNSKRTRRRNLNDKIIKSIANKGSNLNFQK